MTSFLVDILQYGVRGFLLALFIGETKERFQFQIKHTAKWIFGILYIVIQLMLDYAPFMKQVLYGNTKMLTNGSQSLGRMLISFVLVLTISSILYDTNWLQIIYRVSTFYAVTDLAGFGLHSLFNFLLDRIMGFFMYLCIDKSMISIEIYKALVHAAGGIWEVLYVIINLVIVAGILRKISKYLAVSDDQIQKPELLVSLVPSITGLIFSIFVRCVMFEQSDKNSSYFLAAHPETNILIPGVSILCIASIVLCMKMLHKLMEDNKERAKVQVYQSKIIEMEEHIEDIECLYDGIRGMRHDMKNYIADIDALLTEDKYSNRGHSAVKQYLSSLQKSVDQLDLKYHTGNSVADVIIQRYVKLTDRNSVTLECDFCYPKDKGIDAFDLSIILNNGLANALEACLKIPEKDRYIEINSYIRQNMFFIEIQNACDSSQVQVEQGQLKSQKSETKKHGLGMKNMIRCAEKYYGKVEYKILAKSFQVTVMLQMLGHKE